MVSLFSVLISKYCLACLLASFAFGGFGPSSSPSSFALLRSVLSLVVRYERVAWHGMAGVGMLWYQRSTAQQLFICSVFALRRVAG
jgi:hypothetical protein